MFKQATVAEIEAYAVKVRADFEGQGFKIGPNAYGIRSECNTCHESATLNPEMWMRNHSHTTGRRADFEEVTHNADGTRNRVLYFI